MITEPPPSKDRCECGGRLVQREDDSGEAIKERLFIYRKLTEPLLKVFENEGILKKVDGDRPVEDIQTDLIELTKNHG